MDELGELLACIYLSRDRYFDHATEMPNPHDDRPPHAGFSVTRPHQTETGGQGYGKWCCAAPSCAATIHPVRQKAVISAGPQVGDMRLAPTAIGSRRV